MQLEACLPDFWWKFVIAAAAHIYNCTPVRYLKWKTSQEIFLDNKLKTSYFYVFGCGAYVFLSSEVHANKLISHSELMIFIGYKNNRYHFMCYTQGNIIFHSTHAIFDEGNFSKCTDFHVKKCKLYDKLLDKISPETESPVSDSSGKDGPASVLTPHTLIPPIQNNSSTHSSSPFLSYKSISLLSIQRFKKLIVEIEEDDDIDSDVKIQPPSPQ